MVSELGKFQKAFIEGRAIVKTKQKDTGEEKFFVTKKGGRGAIRVTPESAKAAITLQEQVAAEKTQQAAQRVALTSPPPRSEVPTLQPRIEPISGSTIRGRFEGREFVEEKPISEGEIQPTTKQRLLERERTFEGELITPLERLKERTTKTLRVKESDLDKTLFEKIEITRLQAQETFLEETTAFGEFIQARFKTKKEKKEQKEKREETTFKERASQVATTAGLLGPSLRVETEPKPLAKIATEVGLFFLGPEVAAQKIVTKAEREGSEQLFRLIGEKYVDPSLKFTKPTKVSVADQPSTFNVETGVIELGPTRDVLSDGAIRLRDPTDPAKFQPEFQAQLVPKDVSKVELDPFTGIPIKSDQPKGLDTETFLKTQQEEIGTVRLSSLGEQVEKQPVFDLGKEKTSAGTFTIREGKLRVQTDLDKEVAEFVTKHERGHLVSALSPELKKEVSTKVFTTEEGFEELLKVATETKGVRIPSQIKDEKLLAEETFADLFAARETKKKTFAELAPSLEESFKKGLGERTRIDITKIDKTPKITVVSGAPVKPSTTQAKLFVQSPEEQFRSLFSDTKQIGTRTIDLDQPTLKLAPEQKDLFEEKIDLSTFEKPKPSLFRSKKAQTTTGGLELDIDPDEAFKRLKESDIGKTISKAQETTLDIVKQPVTPKLIPEIKTKTAGFVLIIEGEEAAKAIGLEPISKQPVTKKQLISDLPTQDFSFGPVKKTLLEPLQDVSLDPLTKEDQEQKGKGKQKQKQEQELIQDTILVTEQIIEQEKITKPKTITEPIKDFETFKQPKPRTIQPLGLDLQLELKRKQPQEQFRVTIGEKGRTKIFEEKLLGGLEKAALFGKRRTKGTLAAGFAITGITGRPLTSVEEAKAFDILGGEFRPAKKDKKRFIQKRKFRLGTTGEKTQIQRFKLDFGI